MALSILMAMSRETVQLAFTEMPPPSLAGAGENRARKIRAWKRPWKAAKIPGYLHVQEVLDCLQRQLRASWGALLIGSGASADAPLFTRAMLGPTDTHGGDSSSEGTEEVADKGREKWGRN